MSEGYVKTLGLGIGAGHSVEAGISQSENPSIAFDYLANGATKLTVTAKDTDDTVFTHKLPLNPGS